MGCAVCCVSLCQHAGVVLCSVGCDGLSAVRVCARVSRSSQLGLCCVVCTRESLSPVCGVCCNVCVSMALWCAAYGMLWCVSLLCVCVVSCDAGCECVSRCVCVSLSMCGAQ